MKKLIILLFPLVALVGCATYSVVSTDKDDNADFTKYKTYAWLPDKDNSNNELNNQIISNNTKNYFTHEFKDNYCLTSNMDAPDMFMEFQVTAVNKTKTETHPVTTAPYNYYYPYPSAPYPNNRHYYDHNYYTPYPNPHNYGHYYMGYNYATTYITHRHNYISSSITINMIDRRKNQLAWTATAEDDIYDESPEDVKSELPPAVHKISKYFPLKRSKNPQEKKCKKYNKIIS